ncbi:response regulator transcription factor [Roseateles sp. YR242]|uniref:LuxR C-terminal-related transcriptional regulator n=1 Tax=Roseateles sp. YR242 TaxID=1855305 RepID=UPI0015A5AC6D|nr:response regulator transcription factor [Roseateles sp. YR242]
MNSSLKVQVRHGYPLMKQALEALLMTIPGVTLCGEPTRHSQGLSMPDVVIADEDGALRLAASDTRARVIAICHTAREAEVRRVLAAGVRGYVVLGDDVAELIECLQAVARGGRHICRAAARCIADGYGRDELTRREQEVLDLLTEGLCNKNIARRMAIAEGTVKTYVKAVLGKLEARTRAHAVTVALQRGMVTQLPMVGFASTPRHAMAA